MRRIYANPLVRANAGCVALMRGPIVYCVESIDNGENLATLSIPRNAVCEVTDSPQGLPKELDAIVIQGRRSETEGTLYTTTPPKESSASITAIPYFAWGNRGENEMRVWIHEGGI